MKKGVLKLLDLYAADAGVPKTQVRKMYHDLTNSEKRRFRIMAERRLRDVVTGATQDFDEYAFVDGFDWKGLAFVSSVVIGSIVVVIALDIGLMYLFDVWDGTLPFAK